MTIKQLALVAAMYLGTAVLTLLLFEVPIAYTFGLQAVQKSLLRVTPTVVISFLISFLLALFVVGFICHILLDRHIHEYKKVLVGADSSLNNEQKRQGLHHMHLLSIISACLLGLTPLICYLLLIDIRDTAALRSLEISKLNLILINICFGLMAGMLYSSSSQLLFEPVRRSFQLPLQGNSRSVMSALSKMAISTLTACIFVLLMGHLFFDLKREINSRIISAISTSMSDPEAFANIEQAVQSIYEEVAFEYPLSLVLFWDNIDFAKRLNYAESSPDPSADNLSHLNSLSALCIGILLLLLTSFSWLNVYLLARQFKMRVNNIFGRVRRLLHGEESFAENLPVLTFDEIGYFVGYLNLLTMTSQKISQDVQKEANKLVESLDLQTTSVATLRSIVKDLEENIIVKINSSVVREEEEHHQVMDGGLSSMQDISFKVNSLLNNQRKYVDVIAHQVNTFASLVDNVKQITEKANREAGVLAFSVERGEEAVQSSIIGMREIAEASEAIENIVGAITKIAAQTSLLSMNAAIEAAHAGDYGSGFAVLAQEVRSLSERATAQSRAIREQIESLISGIESGLGISQNTTGILNEIADSIEQNNVFVKNIIDAMKEQHQGSRDIVQLIESSVSRSSQIRNLTDQQIHKSKEIISAMSVFLQISESIMTLSKNASNSIATISHRVEAIEKAIQRNEAVGRKMLQDVVTIDNARALQGN